MNDTYYYQVDDEGFSIAIVSKTFWDKNGCLDDQGIPDDVMPPGFYELSESIFEYEGDPDDAKNALNEAGFVEKKMFV